jgi:hypothetical protein
MEAIRAQDPGDLESESAVTLDREGQPDARGGYTRAVKVENVSSNLKQVTVTVDYPRAIKPIELVTLAFFAAGT